MGDGSVGQGAAEQLGVCECCGVSVGVKLREPGGVVYSRHVTNFTADWRSYKGTGKSSLLKGLAAVVPECVL